jgi:3-deoxy-manno-octulosonate cytidylyltransferase (CMP-KDO synthetase)
MINQKILGVIPARFKSSRFPGKPLALIKGKELILHVCEKVNLALGLENFVVATEDIRIVELVEKYGFRAILTSEAPLTGTDRLWEVAQKIPADYYVNIQGDEPLLKPEDIIKVVNGRLENPEFITNGYCQIADNESVDSINIPKVVFNENNELIYMSRLPIPGIKDKTLHPVYFKQVCIYTFNFEELKAFGEKGMKTKLELFEDIEILRFLELGFKIRMIETSGSSLAVDVPEDIYLIESVLNGKD